MNILLHAKHPGDRASNSVQAQQQSRRLRLFLVVGTSIILANFLVADFFQDDAYISFHYADNLVKYGTLYYNIGEQGPFGYTNPLYIALLSLFRVLTFKLISFELIARMVVSLALAVILIVVLRETQDFPVFVGILAIIECVFLFLAYPFMLPNFFCGLETALFTLSLFVLMYFLWDPNSMNVRVFLMSLALSLGLRMDSAFTLLPVTGLYVWVIIRKREWRKLRGVVAVFVIVALIFFLQSIIAGYWLPLSFSHKNSGFSFQTLVSYVKFSVVALFLPGLILADKFKHSRKYRGVLLFAVFFSIYIMMFYSFFMHWHFQRYVFPFLFSMFAMLLVITLKTWKNSDWRTLLFLAAYAIVAFMPGTLQGYSWVSGYRAAMKNLEQVANAFNEARLDKGFRTFASYDAGLIAYKTGWIITDLAGLVTPEIHSENVQDVISERNPTVLIVSSAERKEDPYDVGLISQYGGVETSIPANYHFVKRLPLTNRYWWPNSGYSYYIFVNDNANEVLIRHLESISVDPDKETTYQKYIFYVLEKISGLTWY